MSADPNDPLLGRTLDGRYRVDSRVARGGMATVYKATDLRLERVVALKVMHPHLSDDADFRERFIQEAKISARITHPNVVNVFDQGTRGELAYLVMEYVPSITLRDHLLKHGALKPNQAMQVTEAVLAGLTAAHSLDLVHRDIKPENILLANDGRIKISDFGLARAASANTATGKALLGTIAYLSPELVTRGQADKRSDMYAVGIMLFEMLTGKQPFTGDQPMQIAYQHANSQVPKPSTIEPGIPRALDLLVEWATQRDPALRPRDAAEMLEYVREAREGGQHPTAATAILQGAAAEPTTRVHEPLRSHKKSKGSSPAPSKAPANALTTIAEPVQGAPGLLQEKAERRSARTPFWIGAVVLLGLLLLWLGWSIATGPAARASVPEVAGMSVEAAEEAMAEAGFTAAPSHTEEHHYEVPAGQVVRTEPGAGTTMHPEDPIVLVISSGPESLPVPDVAGLSAEEARSRITEAGFTVDDALVQHRYSADAPEGAVLRAVGKEGKALEPGSSIEGRSPMGYVVSLGPLPATEGQSKDEALAALDAAGIIYRIVEEESESVPEGAVVRVDAEGEVAEGDTVEVVISTGPPMREVPNVVGMTYRDGVDAMRDAGFEVNTDTIVPEALWGAFRVKQQDPKGGTEAPVGSEVRLTGEF